MRKIRKRSFFETWFTEEEYKKDVSEPDNFCSRLVKDDDLEYIIKHFNELCRYDHDQFSIILNYLKMNTYRIRDKSFLEKLKNSLIYHHMLYERIGIDDNDLDRIRFIINKLAEDEGADFFDLKQISRGSYSTAYRLGNKVVKIGRSRATKIIDNSRILIPDQMLNIDGNVIEINDYVKDVRCAYIEDVYKVYKELREQGIVWMDPWFSNLGRLDRRVIESQKEKAKNRGNLPFIIGNRKFKYRELKYNDYVIVDLDHFVDENDKKTIKWLESEVLDEFRVEARKDFEHRYRLENKKSHV